MTATTILLITAIAIVLVGFAGIISCEISAEHDEDEIASDGLPIGDGDSF